MVQTIPLIQDKGTQESRPTVFCDIQQLAARALGTEKSAF